MSRPDRVDIEMVAGLVVIIVAFAWGYLIGRFG